MQSLLRALPGYALILGLTQLDPQFLPRPGAPEFDSSEALRRAGSI